MKNNNYVIGTLCIIAGIVIIIFTVGDLLVRLMVAIAALSLINYGLRLRGFPPLQLLIPLLANRKRWF